MSAKNWVFTINTPTDQDAQTLDNVEVTFIIYQFEQVDTLHIQGYVQFPVRKTLTQVKRLLSNRGHYEVARGSPQQCIAYCSKEESRVRGPYERGTVSLPGARSDIQSFITSIKELKTDAILIEDHPNEFLKYHKAIDRIRNSAVGKRTWPMEVSVYWGASGSGKTRRALEEAGEDAYFVSKGDQTHAVWWDGYTGQDAIIIDDFYGWLPWSFMLRLLDRYPFSVQLKGSYREITSTRIYITSNQPPETWYKRVPNNDLTPLLRRINVIAEMQ